jgi:integrase
VEYFFSHRALSLKPSTQYCYGEVVRTTLMPMFGDRVLATLSRKDFATLDAELVRRGAGGSRRRNHIVTMRAILRASVVGELLEDVPRFPPVPKVGMRVPHAPTQEEVAAVIASARPCMRVAFALAAYAGLRAGEVRALRRMDVDLDGGVIVVRQARTRGVTSTPKSGHEREIPIAAALRPFIEDAAFRCPSPDAVILDHSTRLSTDEGLLRRELAAAQRRAGTSGWSFHGLRHAFVTHLFRRGVPAPVVQRLAGHIHLSVTQRYAHTHTEDLRAAIALL